MLKLTALCIAIALCFALTAPDADARPFSRPLAGSCAGLRGDVLGHHRRAARRSHRRIQRSSRAGAAASCGAPASVGCGG